MAFFDQLYQKLFNSRGSETSLILHEVIVRNEKYLQGYEQWKLNGRATKMISDYSRSYHFKKSGIQSEPNVHVFASSASNGFALTYSPDFDKQEFQFLFDYLAEISKTLGYRQVNSDVTITEKNDTIETREKHYLKPPICTADQLSKQLFGNILVEYIMIDDQPSYIKLLANIYFDRQYEPAEDHRELISHLFSID